MTSYNGIFLTLWNIIKATILSYQYRFILFIYSIILSFVCLISFYISFFLSYSSYCNIQFKNGLIEANRRGLWNVVEGVQDKFMPILMPVCDRPHYLKRVLDGLAKVDGINETVVVFSQDCVQPSIISLIASAPSHIRTLILQHTPRFHSLPKFIHGGEYAIAANVRFLFEFAFEHMLANGIMYIESDIVPSVDFYRYHQWAYRTLLAINNSKILSVHSFNLDSKKGSDPFTLFPRRFHSWGFATARTRWNWLKKEWTRDSHFHWDTTLNEAAARAEWICLAPQLSRTKMIGLKGNTVKIKDAGKIKQFEEDMYMSDKIIEYKDIKPKIIP